jgi:hypothetical protein
MEPSAAIAGCSVHNVGAWSSSLTAAGDLRQKFGSKRYARQGLVDGRVYSGGPGAIVKPVVGEVKNTWNVRLRPGKHVIYVQADTGVNQGVSE